MNGYADEPGFAWELKKKLESGFLIEDKTVAGSALGNDIGRFVGVCFYFAAQPMNVDVQPVFLSILHRPDAVEKKFGCDDAASVADQNVE
jgi:hypothetical protein